MAPGSPGEARRRIAGAAVLVAALGLTGCPGIGLLDAVRDATFGGRGAAGTLVSTPVPAGPIDPVLAFVATARDDESGVVTTAGGREERVVVGRAYDAASGRRCRRFRHGPMGQTALERRAVACRGDNGVWSRVPGLGGRARGATGG